VVRRVTLPSIPRTPLIDTANPAAHMPLDPLQERIARTALAIIDADHDSVYFVPACVTRWVHRPRTQPANPRPANPLPGPP
jgi:hypothetical protein